MGLKMKGLIYKTLDNLDFLNIFLEQTEQLFETLNNVKGQTDAKIKLGEIAFIILSNKVLRKNGKN